MNQILRIPFVLRDIPNIIEVIYKANESAVESGFDALNLPFDANLCIGYPVVHAYVKDMSSTGYRRSCGWIQLVKREYYSSAALDYPDENETSVDTNDPACIYLAYGSPAEIYDAPCNNLNGNSRGKWTAFTYLVDIPSRMNGYKMIFLAGFQWGYEEACINGNISVNMLEISEINHAQWNEHIPCMKERYPQYNYSLG